MARIRTIKPEFPQSESMGRVSRDARLCFIMLWTIADDEGRLRGNSRMLASLLFPYDDDAKRLIDKWMRELEDECCITRYQVAGDNYVEIRGWASHQKIDKPSKSKLPCALEGSRILANPLEAYPLDQGEDQGEDQGDSAEVEASPPAALLPLVDKTEYAVTTQQAQEWATAYPAVDVLQQLREMRTWSLANPSKRKTRRGVESFVVRWLSAEQDKAGKVPQRQTDVRSITVPGSNERDPALKKLDDDAKTTKPIPAHLRGALADLTKQFKGPMQ